MSERDFYLIKDKQTTKEQWLVLWTEQMPTKPSQESMTSGFQDPSLSGNKEVHSLALQKTWQILETSKRGKFTEMYRHSMQILLEKVLGSLFPTLGIEE